ncbi:uncharacterized protein LOC111347641, partial [Stylophora pistillata]|uniref:uncharacterized protein LOC111347641 n=1 Tax=Stylophora pistillata TaxID=50429 RepID=UPI000C0439E3
MCPGLSVDLRQIDDSRKTAIIKKELTRLNIDVACLQETRLADSGSLRESGYTFFWQGLSQDEPRQHGVGFAVRNSLLATTETLTGGSERILVLRMKTSTGYFKCKELHKVSWRHSRSRHWHKLDLVITRRADLSSVLHTRSYHSADCDTDHSLVGSKIRLKPCKIYHAKTKGCPRINTCATADPAKAQSFVETLQKKLAVFSDANAQQCSVGGVSKLGMMLQRHIFKRITGASLGDVCYHECTADVRCQSFNYVFTQETCELNNRTKEARPEDYVPNVERYYFKRDLNRVPLGSIPELAAETCQEIKLSEGGQAVSGKYWFSSIVPAKTVLAPCDMKTEDVDECNSTIPVCDINAKCVNTISSHSCKCKAGFTGNGKKCIDVDECTKNS